MLVTSVTMGDSRKNSPKASQASATRYWLAPSWAPVLWKASTWPPTTRVGSSPARWSTIPIMEVVVVLPWVPDTAMPYLRRISSANISVRGITGIARRLASCSSGLSIGTAAEKTATSAPRTFSALWAKTTLTPMALRRSVTSEDFRSDPLTS